MEFNISDIGKIIRSERIRLGLTQEQLGNKIGVGKARISKIEKGECFTVKTILKVMKALNLSLGIYAVNSGRPSKDAVGYIVAVINEFAYKYNMSIRGASNYLRRYKGIDFLTEHYEAEHLLSIYDGVTDVARICYNNGGGLI